MPAKLVPPRPPHRSHIDLTKADEVRYWIKHLGVEKTRLAGAIEKVGNSVAAVRKELNIGRTGEGSRGPEEPRRQ